MLSYASIQRKVRTINLTFGTKYSAKQIYERQKAAEAKGQTTVDYERIKSVITTRADVKRAADPTGEGGGKLFLYQVWSDLGERQPQVAAILRAREGVDLIDSHGHIWRRVDLGHGPVWEDQVSHRIRRPDPEKSSVYTGEKGYKAIIKIRDHIDLVGASRPREVYDDYDIDTIF